MKGQDSEVRPATILRAAAVAALAGLTALAALSGCAAGTGSAAKSPGAATSGLASPRQQKSASPSAPPATAPAATTATPTPTPTAIPTPTPTAIPTPTPTAIPTPKLLALPVAPPAAAGEPQTTKLPDTSSTAFTNEVHDIWLAVTTGNAAFAKPAFFPEKAYQQVKAISDPNYDWQDRLWYDFTLDLAAVRKLVPEDARLETVLVPAHDAVWIPAGACYNNVGYWHISNSRVVYTSGGATHSFGIASFISWRGAWYLIHFGAVVRSSDYGIVDDPETGPGSAGPTANC